MIEITLVWWVIAQNHRASRTPIRGAIAGLAARLA